jgi:hypothetical protein
VSNGVAETPWTRIVQRLASRLRYPHIFLLVLGLFVVDLLVPDMLPFVDEALLGLLTLLLGALRTRRDERTPEVEIIDGEVVDD